MKKTYLFSNNNGTFVCFNDYENEDDFDEFLSFVCGKIHVAIPPKVQHPYSMTAELVFSGVPVIAMFHSDAGCCLRFDSVNQSLANEIVGICYDSDS